MSRKSNTQQRRQEITAAFLRVLATQGYEKATIQAIAKEAELTPGLIHYHFSTKAEILVALITTLTTVFEARFEDLLSRAQTPRERLQAYVEARLAKGEGENPEAVAAWVIIGAEAIKQEEVRTLYAQAIAKELRLLQGLLADYLLDQGKRESSARHLAATLLSTMEGSFQLASAAAEHMPKRYAAKTVLLMIERFVALEPAEI